MMATLAELLALLPDNDTGEIDAADLREIVTALWDETATAVSSLQAQINSIETGSGLMSYTGRWQVNSMPGTVPGDMQVTVDTATVIAATWVRVAKLDQQGNDTTAALLAAEKFYAQMQADASTWARFLITGDAVDQGTYVELPVAYDDGAGSTETVAWQNVVAVLTWTV